MELSRRSARSRASNGGRLLKKLKNPFQEGKSIALSMTVGFITVPRQYFFREASKVSSFTGMDSAMMAHAR